MQPADALVRQLARDEAVRNDTVDLAAGVEYRIGDYAHQTDVAAAVDDANLPAGQLGRECPRRIGERRIQTRTRTAEDAESHAAILRLASLAGSSLRDS
jgi:hypothetical protein